MLALLNVSLPFTSVVFTMAVAGIFLSGALLPPRYAFLAQVIYLGLGVSGLPVFSKGQAGIAVFAGPTGGYLLAYPIMAFIIALPLRLSFFHPPLKIFAVFTASLIILYAFGTLWFSFVQRVSPLAALTSTVFPFIPFDIAKAALCALVVFPLRKRLLY